MSELPRQLKPWAPQLGLLHRELALGLGPWIQRLASAIGALAGTADPHTGDPDGYDGVTRRGPYERLLPTEWLFAEAAPDEFNRRAAVGEHQFYRLATREPNATRRCLVLFDAGPSQLGTPRIAHLAALIVFAARCEAAKAELFWGTLQAGPARVQNGFTRARANTLLEGRSALEGTPDQLHAWLTAPELKADDVWLVGGSTSPGAPKLNRLEVTDVLELSARRVDVTVRRPARTTLRLQLELPPAADCTRLLRAPFADPKPPRPPRTAISVPMPQGNLVFGVVANRLHMLGPEGELLVLPVPTEGQNRVRAVVYRPAKNERVVGVGWKTGPQAVVARHDLDGRLTHFGICALTRRGDLKRTPTLFPVADRVPGALDGLRAAAFQFDRVLLAFPDGVLTLFGDRAKFSPMPVFAHAATGSGLALVTADSSGRHFVMVVSVGESKPAFLEQPPMPLRAFFGRGYRGGTSPSTPALLMGHAMDPHDWTLETYSQKTTLAVRDPLRVVGASGRSPNTAGAIVLGEDRRSLLLQLAKETKPLGQTDAPIVSVATDFESDLVAWLDEKGRVGLCHLGASGRFLVGTGVKGSNRFHFRIEKVQA